MGDDSLRHEWDRFRYGGHLSDPVADRSDDKREAWTKALELRFRGCGQSEALAYCERELKLDPDQWRLWVEYGSALFAENRFPEGVEAYLQALTLHPCSAWLWDRTGG